MHDLLAFRGTEPDTSWHEHAACRGVDPELFFPPRGGEWDEARHVCERCPVRRECLEYALETGEKFGIWGGTSERQRRGLRVRRLRDESERRSA